jgi:hypothetical protein
MTFSSDSTELFVIDWELAQVGPRVYDLGQMVGDLYERQHFNHVDGALWVLEGFADGYGQLSNEMAFRTAIHAGVHLIGWYNRRPPDGALDAPLDRATEAMALGRDFVLKGWERDREWFRVSVLAPLFA